MPCKGILEAMDFRIRPSFFQFPEGFVVMYMAESVQKFVKQQERGVLIPLLLKHLRVQRHLAHILGSDFTSLAPLPFAVATNPV